jgi:hypothetical protein
VWKEKKETLERKREGVYSKLLFNLCKLFIVEIKQCVLYPLSVSKPPPVASPTNTPLGQDFTNTINNDHAPCSINQSRVRIRV